MKSHRCHFVVDCLNQTIISHLLNHLIRHQSMGPLISYNKHAMSFSFILSKNHRTSRKLSIWRSTSYFGLDRNCFTGLKVYTYFIADYSPGHPSTIMQSNYSYLFITSDLLLIDIVTVVIFRVPLNFIAKRCSRFRSLAQALPKSTAMWHISTTKQRPHSFSTNLNPFWSLTMHTLYISTWGVLEPLFPRRNAGLVTPYPTGDVEPRYAIATLLNTAF